MCAYPLGRKTTNHTQNDYTDPYDTDNAWVETSFVHFHIEDYAKSKLMQLCKTESTLSAEWCLLEEIDEIMTGQDAILAKAAEAIGASFANPAEKAAAFASGNVVRRSSSSDLKAPIAVCALSLLIS